MDATTTNATNCADRLTEPERLQLHNILLERQALYSRLETLTMQFLRSQEARALQDRIDELTERANTETERLFINHGVNPQTHQLDVKQGIFVARTAQRTDHVD
jgi:hypothetical protein